MARKTDKLADMFLNPLKAREPVFIHTGNDLLDILFGAGLGYGIESGQCVGLWAPPGAGKTLFANEVIAWGYQMFGDKFKHEYQDPEYGNNFDTEADYGFKLNRKHVRTVEEWSVATINFMRSLADDEFGITILDSWDLLQPEDNRVRMEARIAKAEKGETFDEGSMQLGKQKYVKQEAGPIIKELSKQKNCILIIILQVIDKIGATGFQEKKASAAGNFWEHNFDTKIKMAKREELSSSGQVIGHSTIFSSIKLRGPLLKWDCLVNIYPGTIGIDNVGSNIDYLFDLKTDTGAESLTKKAVWSGIPDTMENIKRFMEEHQLYERFYQTYKKSAVKMEYFEFFKSDPELQTLYESTFGSPMNREELILYVERNNLEDELTQRVRQKFHDTWDTSKAFLSQRKSRFSGVAHG